MSAKSMFARLWDNFIALTIKWGGSGSPRRQADDAGEQYKHEPVKGLDFIPEAPKPAKQESMSSAANHMLQRSNSLDNNTKKDVYTPRPGSRPGG